jgi:hypothetical protein
MTLVAKGTNREDRTVGPGPGASALLAAVEVIASFVAGFEPARFGGEDAAILVAAFTRGERLCGAGKTLAATRVVESHTHERSGHRSGPHWLASVTGGSVGDATDLLRLGGSLEHHPGVEEAFRDGRLSSERAALVAGAARVNPGREGDLVAGAERDTLRQLKQRCLAAKAEGRSARDERAAHEALRAARRCRTWTDEDGAVRLDARLAPDTGAALLASLRAQSNRCFERARKAGAHEPAEAYAADALVALVTGRGLLGPGGTGDPPTGDPPTGDPPTGDPPTGERGATRAPDPKARVHLRVDLDALRRGSLGPGEVCEIPGVGPVPVQTARDLLGDALCDLVITNGVDVTTVCHLGRSIPTALDTALLERDRHCVVPGCDVTEGLERDHWIVAFAHGGPATLENLARLCGHHHYLRTHQGFELLGGPGRWRWKPPTTPRPPSGPRGTRRRRTPGRTPPPPTAGPPPPTEAPDSPDPPLFTVEE